MSPGTGATTQTELNFPRIHYATVSLTKEMGNFIEGSSYLYRGPILLRFIKHIYEMGPPQPRIEG